MSRELEKISRGVLVSKSASGVAGKGMVAVGSGAIVLSLLAALIPFVGVLGLGIVFVVLGALMWE